MSFTDSILWARYMPLLMANLMQPVAYAAHIPGGRGEGARAIEIGCPFLIAIIIARTHSSDKRNWSVARYRGLCSGFDVRFIYLLFVCIRRFAGAIRQLDIMRKAHDQSRFQGMVQLLKLPTTRLRRSLAGEGHIRRFELCSGGDMANEISRWSSVSRDRMDSIVEKL